VDELAKEQRHLGVDVQMKAVRFGLLGPKVGRGARERRGGRAKKHLVGATHAVDEVAREVGVNRAFERLVVGAHGTNAPDAEAVRHAFERGLVVHLDAVHALLP
jgi:hypothetical protein